MCENGCGLRPWQQPFLLAESLFSSGISSNIPVHPLNEERVKGERPNKPPSLSETRLPLTLAENGTFRWDTGGLAQASDTDRGELAGSSSQSVPRLLFPLSGSWEQWELWAVITGDVSSDSLLFTHSPGALFLQVSKCNRKWIANELWCPWSKHSTSEFCFPRVNISLEYLLRLHLHISIYSKTQCI